ncbi:hypothetical protein CYMTET_25732 [Cymbomonas tetramitiformis]|uniref:Uncharacterized protein n=1 Tax=Cymbomonas tetramitiformis TaxID=36881 RepID=A0AAE0FT53_9CHLO|nr:hypothetical protein CYMTET_25732 [Cymbomonas tetramitiformis]
MSQQYSEFERVQKRCQVAEQQLEKERGELISSLLEAVKRAEDDLSSERAAHTTVQQKLLEERTAREAAEGQLTIARGDHARMRDALEDERAAVEELGGQLAAERLAHSATREELMKERARIDEILQSYDALYKRMATQQAEQHDFVANSTPAKATTAEASLVFLPETQYEARVDSHEVAPAITDDMTGDASFELDALMSMLLPGCQPDDPPTRSVSDGADTPPMSSASPPPSELSVVDSMPLVDQLPRHASPVTKAPVSLEPFATPPSSELDDLTQGRKESQMRMLHPAPTVTPVCTDRGCFTPGPTVTPVCTDEAFTPAPTVTPVCTDEPFTRPSRPLPPPRRLSAEAQMR